MDPFTIFGLGLVALAGVELGRLWKRKDTTHMASADALAALKASFDKVASAVQAQSAEMAKLRAELVDAQMHKDDAAVMEVANGLDAIAAALATTEATTTEGTTEAAA